ncbi:hypothetical protein CA3LBN_003374 [Candidozyma haemuli]|uniref:Protein YAE1 n=1 Tax=Candidozyma haemuli TaxID=45357 RepID=A0ABX8IE47_9ASCO|nr:hypothetical protein CA3LBN_003374 [[Candida] haemuloni]
MSCTGECKVPKNLKSKKPSHATDDDDIWGSDDDIDTYADLQRAHVTQGYIDGITQAQEEGLQKGFDEGFPHGAALTKPRRSSMLHQFSAKTTLTTR